MHELGIIDELINSIKDKIKDRKDFSRIKKVYLKLGKNANVTEDSLRFWFENHSKGTMCEGAMLEVTLTDDKAITVDSLEVD